MTGLAVKRLINVTVNLGPRAAQFANLDSLVVIGSTDVINTYERIRSYNGLEEIAVDFSVTDPEYKAAALFFGQVPQPEQLYIARWADTDTSGELVGGTVTGTNLNINQWNSISDGSFAINIDNVGIQNITGLDFTSQTNLNGVAEIITEALDINAVTAVVAAAGGTSGAHTSYVPGDTITLAGGVFIDPAILTATHTKAVDVSIVAGGIGGTPGPVTLLGTTGTGTKFQASGTISGGGVLTSVTGLPTVAGDYTVNPTNIDIEPVTGGGLTGCTLKVKMGVLTVAVTDPGSYSVKPNNPVAQDSTSGVGTGATFTMTWDTTVAATCTWTGTHFIIESDSTGPTSTVSYLTATGGGSDISSMMRGRINQTAYPPVDGIDGETPLACVQLLDGLTTNFYGLTFAVTGGLTNNQNTGIAGYIEGATNPHIYGIATADPSALDPESVTDLGYLLKVLGYNRTITQYSLQNYAIASAFGRAFTVDFNENNSVITLAFKTEPGVVPENLTSSQADSLDAKNYMYFATFDNDTAIIVNNVMASGIFFDDQQNADWLANRIQTDVFNTLYTTFTKIPQTDKGVHQLVTTINRSMDAALNNGILGPGNWNFDGFGTLKSGDYLPTGYYVYGNPIASQAIADRQTRVSPPIQVAAIFSGAIQSVNITVNVQR